MKALYTDGLVLYCTAEKGYSFGKSGRLYLNLCNSEQEKKFLPAYHKGRREYLNSMIADTDKTMSELKEQEKRVAASEAYLSQEYSSLPNASECSTRMVYNESTKKDEFKMICQEALYVRNQRDTIYNNLRNTRVTLQSIRADWKKNSDALAEYKLELTKLPN
jgi:hypothetical protein